MPVAIPSTVLEKHADLASEHGSAKRTERKRRTSPSSLPYGVRTGRHEAAHAKISSVTTVPLGSGLAKCEFEFCRQTLKTVFQQCTDTDFKRLSVIISCLLNCVRSLHVTEITTILALLLGRETGTETTEDEVVNELQAKCSPIFFQDSAGYLHFDHPLIPTFLLAYTVKGIDPSHTILARACTTQVELDGGVQSFNLSRIGTPQLRTGVFSGYAAENWQDHYRRAEKGCPSLTAQVHRMLWTELVKMGRCTDCGTFDPELRREALSEVLEWCNSRKLYTLGRMYRQMLIELESLARGPELDQALEQLQLTGSESGSGSDSDSNWSLV